MQPMARFLPTAGARLSARLIFLPRRADPATTERLLRMAFGEGPTLSDELASACRKTLTFEQRRLAAHRVAAEVRARKSEMQVRRTAPRP